jgi:hypothetical protein
VTADASIDGRSPPVKRWHYGCKGQERNINMNGNIIDVRKTYDYLRRCQTHLVQSSEIATACVCQNLFKLDYPFGATRTDKDYLVANTVHDIMSLSMSGPILENWDSRLENHGQIAKKIVNESSEIVNTIIKDTLEGAYRENRFVQDDFELQVNEIYTGLIMGMTRRLMKKYERPSRVLTEVTITNIKDHHEGRIDALLEYPSGYGLLDWKSYDLSNTISGREKWQLIANILLANFRYCRNEDDWTGHNYSCIVHNSGVYFPKTETTKKEVERIKTNRQFAYMVLCGERVRVQRPTFCPVCDKGLEGSKECHFYQRDARLAYEGKLPAQYEKMTKQFFAKRYAILKERAETHLHKHVVHMLINKHGEEEALCRLQKIGILCRGYSYDSDIDEKVIFSRADDNIPLEPRRIIRVIGIEPGKPLLSCINEQASVMEVRNNKITLSFRSKLAVQRAKGQLFHLPIILLRDELNLTRSMLRPIHQFHRLAADIFIPPELVV